MASRMSDARRQAAPPPGPHASPAPDHAHGADAASGARWCAAGLLRVAAQRRADALASGHLQPIATEQAWIACPGTAPWSVRWVSSLAHKDRARVDQVTRRTPDFNPFLPPEPALTVGALGPDHLVVLNKFPVIDTHLLIVTRHFEDQRTPLRTPDFCALAALLQAHGGLGFYNGGRTAGASQAHKHLQWIPTAAGTLGAFAPADERQANPALPWAHAFQRLAADTWSGTVEFAGSLLEAAFRGACAALALPPAADPMPPYNLLVDRERLLLVPRAQEKWQDVSVNALAYAGSLFAREPAQIERLRAAGPLAVIAAVGLPPPQAA